MHYATTITLKYNYSHTFDIMIRIVLIATLSLCMLNGLNVCKSGKDSPEAREDIYRSVEGDGVQFKLYASGKEIIVPAKLQSILLNRFSNSENERRFPKTLLNRIGYFYLNGESWEWCGGRLHSSTGKYYYIPELDPNEDSWLYNYVKKSRQGIYDKKIDSGKIDRLEAEVKLFFSAYD